MIKNLPSRYPELGRIRLGSKGPKGEPRKGKTLRFSSDDDVVLKALADQLGGEVKAWDDPKAEQAWHLTTESSSVPILLPPDPIDTTYEKWGSGGIAKRCDGERCIMPVPSVDGGHMVESDCACLDEGLVPGDRDDQKKGACQVTVRLRLIIPSVPGLGAWICTSHSIYAAMELPGQVELLQAMSGAGRLVPADFAIEPRTEKKPWEKYKRDYIVPVLRVRASLAQLASGEAVAGELASVGNGSGGGEAGLAHPATAPALLPADPTTGEVTTIRRPPPKREVDEAVERHPATTDHGTCGTCGKPINDLLMAVKSAGKRHHRACLMAPAPHSAPPADDASAASAGAGPGGEPSESAAPGSPPTNLISEPQNRNVHRLLRKLTVPEDDKHRYCCDLIGIPVVESLNDLTKRQATTLIEALMAEAGEA